MSRLRGGFRQSSSASLAPSLGWGPGLGPFVWITWGKILGLGQYLTEQQSPQNIA